MAIDQAHFKTPTPIQILAIPAILDQKDYFIEAQTGSGKTAVFVFPILHQLTDSNDLVNIKVLIITPTRELALQISKEVKKFSEFLPRKVSVLSVIGGENIEQQKLALKKGIDIIVATPGRLNDLLVQNELTLSHVKHFIIDEADKILSLGFLEELDLLLHHLPKVRQNLFFSATYPDKISILMKKISTSATSLKLTDVAPTVSKINQRVFLINKENRGALLRELIVNEKLSDLLVFVSTKVAAKNLCEKLKKYKIKALCLHGDMEQKDRIFALAEFKNKKCDVLVATDLAARGININELEVVINFDLPRSPADYIHRIGRTARNGKTGMAISFVGIDDDQHFKLIEKRAQINLKREEYLSLQRVGEPVVNKSSGPGIKGKRKSKKDKRREN